MSPVPRAPLEQLVPITPTIDVGRERGGRGRAALRGAPVVLDGQSELVVQTVPFVPSNVPSL